MGFVKNFLLGAATAAHQVEGNNIHSDFWRQEQMKNGGFAQPSGDAVDHYHRYEEDIRLLAQAGLNAYRFSIEWARIEPEEGRFDERELAHYRDVLACCKANRVTPVVTLHHFSSPAWLIEQGGWESEATVEYFARYAGYIAEHLGGELEYVCTINEANMGVQVAAVAKRYMQQMMRRPAKQGGAGVQAGLDLQTVLAERRKAAAAETMAAFGVEKAETFTTPRTEQGDEIIRRAHRAAVKELKIRCPHLKVGLTLSLHDIQPQTGGEEEALRQWREEFLHYLPDIREDDFLGVQNYTRVLVNADGSMPAPEGAELTQMDYEFYPQGLEHVLRKVTEEFHGTLLVTENGVATADDGRRVVFIDEALAGVKRCVADGLPVAGYFYWSLLDNFEWQKGYSMTFGLIGVDRATQTRYPKGSLRHLGGYAGI